MKRIAVFCGSSKGNHESFITACHNLIDVFESHNISMVYGGGKVGLMGVLADEMLRRNMEVIGVIPQKLMDWEVGHTEITELHIVDTMHKRKELMAEYADGFVALPGGIGTLEEIIEVFTWLQLGYHNKPCGFLNVEGYYDELVNFFHTMIKMGFLTQERIDSLIIDSNPESLIDRFFQFVKSS